VHFRIVNVNRQARGVEEAHDRFLLKCRFAASFVPAHFMIPAQRQSRRSAATPLRQFNSALARQANQPVIRMDSLAYQFLAVSMQLPEAFALTPALSPRRGRPICLHREKPLSSDRHKPVEGRSLSPGERAGVRASLNSYFINTV